MIGQGMAWFITIIGVACVIMTIKRRGSKLTLRLNTAGIILVLGWMAYYAAAVNPVMLHLAEHI